MIVIGLALKAAAAGIATTIMACSARNMYQASVVAGGQVQMCSADAWIRHDFSNLSSQQVVDQLTTTSTGLGRRELLQLFLSCNAPSKEDIVGEWTGVLLDNNSWIMTTVTALITHQLFGQGRLWKGKIIRDDSTGINRFVGPSGDIEPNHAFHYEIGPSLLDGSPALKHYYAPYQFMLSPWKSMNDELRWVKCSSGKVMIGIGYFRWSGGVLNSSPFLLYTK